MRLFSYVSYVYVCPVNYNRLVANCNPAPQPGILQAI